MPTCRRNTGRALVVLGAVMLAACAPERSTEPPLGPSAEGLAARAVLVQVDVAAGTATVLDRAPAAAKAPASFALLGSNEITATISNVSRSALGQFTPKKVTVRFDVALTNRTSSALLEPTFPAPPAGVHGLLLFPFATTVTGGTGAVDAGADFDGGLTNFFKDGNCTGKTNTDCYRYEPYAAPLAAGATTGASTVGFDVGPAVTAFTVYFVLSADLQIPASISGVVSSRHRGPLGHVVVSLNPVNRSTGTANTGAYRFDNVVPGSYTLSLSGLPGYCEPAATQSVAVASGANATVNFDVACPYIAFSSDRGGIRQIYRMNLDGTGQAQLTTGACIADNPSWSPDGARIAYSCTDGSSPPPIPIVDLYVMNADGSNPVRLTDGTSRNIQPDWGPDGRIVFSTWRDGNDELYVMNADGTNPVRLTQTPDSGEFYPSWSGDGSQIVFDKTGYKRTTDTFEPDGDDIRIMNADGSGTTLIFSNVHGTVRDPAWSPTSNLVSFWGVSGCCGDAIFTEDVVTRTVTQLMASVNPVPQLSQAPEWSPDGSRIVFAGLSGNNLDVFVMGVDGSGVTDLTNQPGNDDFPAWQP